MDLEPNSAVSTFLIKLWDLVENPSTNDLICWDISGRSFHVVDQIRFAREILPLSFKHNNIASFIRQLNMYGFRKVLSTNTLNLKAEKEDLTFAHPYFQQGQKSLLKNIKRKSAAQSQSLASFSREDVSKILNEVSSLKNQLDSMTDTLENLRVENEVLWKEVVNLRQKHARQQQVVSKLVQFFISLVNNDHSPGSLKRKLPLMIKGPSNEKAYPSPMPQGLSQSDEMNSPKAALINLASTVQKINQDGKCLAGKDGGPRVLYLKKNPTSEIGKTLTEKNGGPKILYLKKNATAEQLATQQLEPLTIRGLDNLPSLGLSDLLEELKPQNGNSDVSQILQKKSDSANLESTSKELVMKYEPRIIFKEFDKEEFSRSLNTSQNTLDNVYDLLNNTHPNLEDCVLFGDQLETEENGEHLAKKTKFGDESAGKELMHYVPPEELNLNESLSMENPAENTFFSKPGSGDFSPNFIQDLDIFNMSPWISPSEDESHE